MSAENSATEARVACEIDRSAIETAKKQWESAWREFDRLTVLMAGGGVGVTSQLLLQISPTIPRLLALLAGAMFAIALMTSLWSQRESAKVAWHLVHYHRLRGDQKQPHYEAMAAHRERVEKYNWVSERSIGLGLLLMVLSLLVYIVCSQN